MQQDERGLALTTSSAKAAEEFNNAMGCFFHYKLPMGGI